MKRKKNKKSKKTIISLCIIIPVVLVIAAAAVLCAPLIMSYYENAYEGTETVERQEPYVMPETEPHLWDTGVQTDTDAEDEYYYEPTTSDSSSTASAAAPEPYTGGVYYGYMKNSFKDSANAVSVYGKTPIYTVQQKNPDVFNILVLGTDSRDVTRERGRSDSMIIMSYNKKTGKIKMVSLLRDSLVPIENHGWNRINAAYSFDGVGLAVNTVNQLFDLDIQHFVVIDFNGARNFVDYVGGIDIKLTEAEAKYYNRTGYMGKDVSAGLCHMNGSMALTYMRTRKLDSDFGRTERQRTVITTLAQKILDEKSVTDIYDLTDYAFKLVKTNIPAPTLLSFVSSIAMNGKNLSIESETVPFANAYQNKTYNGMAILSFDIEAAAKKVNEFLYGV